MEDTKYDAFVNLYLKGIRFWSLGGEIWMSKFERTFDY
jgi:hypothetical protein